MGQRSGEDAGFLLTVFIGVYESLQCIHVSDTLAVRVGLFKQLQRDRQNFTSRDFSAGVMA